jgi:3-oxoacyl-[acyl-carrier-protein] synthase II
LDDVVITGVGVVCPLGVGNAAVWESLETGRAGIRTIDEYAAAGWPAPFGGVVDHFDGKEHVQPRKSLKVMAREIQFAFAAAEMAAVDAGLPDEPADPDRVGVVLGAGLIHCEFDELIGPYRACATPQGFDPSRWGSEAFREFFPLWMLKYLPNMPACHVGIRRDARGPTNTIANGDVSSLLAVGEAADVIRRGHADIMFTGGVSSRLAIGDLLWRGTERLATECDDPATACRPFASDRRGAVMGEGAALFVLESARHAAARGAEPLARVGPAVSRFQNVIERSDPPRVAMASALAAALEAAGVAPNELSHINAHGLGTRVDDAAEATAIASVLGAASAEVPVLGAKSYFGNLGAGGGAVELAVSLLAHRARRVVPTYFVDRAGDDCPIRVTDTWLHESAPWFAALNHNGTGQAVAVMFETL